MDVTPAEGRDEDASGGTECIVGQPRAEERGEAPPTDSCDNSLTNVVSRLLPSQAPSPLRKQKGVDGSSPVPVCTPPSSLLAAPPPPPPPPSSCNRQNCRHHPRPPRPRPCPHHPSKDQKRLSSSKSSTSGKTEAVHIQEVAEDDCCVHCVLDCLFCELLSMCAVLGDCLACGVGGAACCDSALCCCGCVEAACSEDACQALLDCGILGECCGSSDCLEVCLECCSICFPS